MFHNYKCTLINLQTKVSVLDSIYANVMNTMLMCSKHGKLIEVDKNRIIAKASTE